VGPRAFRSCRATCAFGSTRILDVAGRFVMAITPERCASFPLFRAWTRRSDSQRECWPSQKLRSMVPSGTKRFFFSRTVCATAAGQRLRAAISRALGGALGSAGARRSRTHRAALVRREPSAADRVGAMPAPRRMVTCREARSRRRESVRSPPRSGFFRSRAR
jgi:hypothetical protein